MCHRGSERVTLLGHLGGKSTEVNDISELYAIRKVIKDILRHVEEAGHKKSFLASWLTQYKGYS